MPRLKNEVMDRVIFFGLDAPSGAGRDPSRQSDRRATEVSLRLPRRRTGRYSDGMIWIAVGTGGALGAMLRLAVVGWAARAFGTGFPLGTLAVNVLGSFAMGLIAAAFLLRAGADPVLRGFLMTGLLGGFTTFSAFSLDAFTLFEEGRIGAATGYVLASVMLSIGALIAGIALVRGSMT